MRVHQDQRESCNWRKPPGVPGLALIPTTCINVHFSTAHALRAAAVLALGLALSPPIALATGAALAQTRPANATGELPVRPKTSSGLPIPRFVSLKADRINMRSGPGQQYPTKWVYRQAGLPVEVIREFEGWRQVRDAEGITGWIIGSLLSGRRTALVVPWERARTGRLVPLRTAARTDSSEIAKLEAGVIANVRYCDGSWCSVSVGPHLGFVEQTKLWGVYPKERVR